MRMRDFYFPAIIDNQPWQRWQRAIVDAIRNQLDGTLLPLSPMEVDWESWRSHYERDRLAAAAADGAL